MKIKKIFSSETTWPFGIKVCKNDVCEILIGKKTLKIYSETKLCRNDVFMVFYKDYQLILF